MRYIKYLPFYYRWFISEGLKYNGRKRVFSAVKFSIVMAKETRSAIKETLAALPEEMQDKSLQKEIKARVASGILDELSNRRAQSEGNMIGCFKGELKCI